MAELTYSVPGMTCSHCEAAITSEVCAIPGVASIDIDLETKLVRVAGSDLDDARIVAAIDEAGYEAVTA